MKFVFAERADVPEILTFIKELEDWNGGALTGISPVLISICLLVPSLCLTGQYTVLQEKP